MPNWNSKKVEADLRNIPGVYSVTNTGPGGDCDSDHFRIDINDVYGEHLFVCGFTMAVNGVTTPSDCECEMVELTDGQQSDIGLTSDTDQVGEIYLKVRKYFKQQGFDVVQSIGAYF